MTPEATVACESGARCPAQATCAHGYDENDDSDTQADETWHSDSHNEDEGYESDGNDSTVSSGSSGSSITVVDRSRYSKTRSPPTPRSAQGYGLLCRLIFLIIRIVSWLFFMGMFLSIILPLIWHRGVVTSDIPIVSYLLGNNVATPSNSTNNETQRDFFTIHSTLDKVNTHQADLLEISVQLVHMQWDMEDLSRKMSRLDMPASEYTASLYVTLAESIRETNKCVKELGPMYSKPRSVIFDRLTLLESTIAAYRRPHGSTRSHFYQPEHGRLRRALKSYLEHVEIELSGLEIPARKCLLQFDAVREGAHEVKQQRISNIRQVLESSGPWWAKIPYSPWTTKQHNLLVALDSAKAVDINGPEDIFAQFLGHTLSVLSLAEKVANAVSSLSGEDVVHIVDANSKTRATTATATATATATTATATATLTVTSTATIIREAPLEHLVKSAEG